MREQLRMKMIQIMIYQTKLLKKLWGYIEPRSILLPHTPQCSSSRLCQTPRKNRGSWVKIAKKQNIVSNHLRTAQLFTRIFPCNLPFTISGAPDVRIFTVDVFLHCFEHYWKSFILNLPKFRIFNLYSPLQLGHTLENRSRRWTSRAWQGCPSKQGGPSESCEAISMHSNSTPRKAERSWKAKHLQRFSEYQHALIFKGRKTPKLPLCKKQKDEISLKTQRPEILATRPSSKTSVCVPEQFMMIFLQFSEKKLKLISYHWQIVKEPWTSSWCPTSCLVVAEICKAESVGKSTFTKLPCPDDQIRKKFTQPVKVMPFELICLLNMLVFLKKTGHMQVSMHWKYMYLRLLVSV